MPYIELKINQDCMVKLLKHGHISIDQIQCDSIASRQAIQAIALGLSRHQPTINAGAAR